jgi:tetratricopeptide (TPR) repeat protein
MNTTLFLSLAFASLQAAVLLPAGGPAHTLEAADPWTLVRTQEQDRGKSEALAQADILLLEGHRPHEALARYREVLNDHPQDFETLWRASRACLILGILEERWEPRKAWYREGAELARQAGALRPDDIDPTYWRAANLGRWAQEETGSREILRLVREVRSTADSVLRVDPNHAGAHNILGMYHFEILKLSAVKRNIARILAPSALRNVHWQDASGHLRRAVALDPFNILYLKDYGRALLWHGDTLEAQAHLRRATVLPVILPTDPIFLREAGILLDAAGG